LDCDEDEVLKLVFNCFGIVTRPQTMGVMLSPRTRRMQKSDTVRSSFDKALR